MPEPIVVTVVIDDIANVLRFFDRVKIERSTTVEAGPYAEISTAATRIPLLPKKRIYEFVDPAGEPTYYYRTVYYNSSSGLDGPISDPALGEGDPALNLLTPQELKDFYLFGIDLTNDAGEPYPDTLFRHYIRSAVDRAEKALDINLVRRQHVEQYDFYRQDWRSFIKIELDEIPIISVDEVQLVLPSNQPVLTFDPSWVRVHQPSGMLNIVPGSGSIALISLGNAGAWLPFLGRADFLPEVFHITHTAGFPNGRVPPVLKDLVGKYASFGPLNIAGDLIAGAGIAAQSLSIDGLSQSISTTSSATNAGYGARILQYEKEIKSILPQLKNYFHPISMVVV